MKGPWICLALVVLTACRSADATAGWSIVSDTLSGGTVHVVNTPPADGPPEWTLEETLRIGAVDGPASFADIKGFAVLADGRIAVMDGSSQELRIFGADGAHLVTWGGKGDGPEELAGAYGLMIQPDGVLVVPDYRNARMSMFDAETGFRASAPMNILSRGFVWRGATVLPDRIWEPTITLGPPRANVMRLYGPDLKVVDSLPMPADPEIDQENPPGSWVLRSSDGRGRGFVGVPFFALAETLIDPRGVIWSTPGYGDGAYRIRRWEPGGDTTLVLEARRAAVAVTEAARDSALTSIRAQLGRIGAADLDPSKVPATRPAVAGMFLSEEGDLWVRTPVVVGEVFDVYDRDGHHQRTVENRLSLYRFVRPYVRQDELWAVAVDELDVQYLVRARIVSAR